MDSSIDCLQGTSEGFANQPEGKLATNNGKKNKAQCSVSNVEACGRS